MEVTLEQVRTYCQREKLRVIVDEKGLLFHAIPGSMPTPATPDLMRELVADSEGEDERQRQLRSVVLSADGYMDLAMVLRRAFDQAAHGKGKERHAQGEPFTEQVMQDMARRFGVGALLGQAFKKSEESQRLPHDKSVAELLGAINYLAGAIIAKERAHITGGAYDTLAADMAGVNYRPANDNTPRCCSNSSKPQTSARCGGCAESGAFGGSAVNRA